MEKRKNPEKDLRKQSGLFFHIGLLAAMMLAVSAFEYRTEKVVDPVDITEGNVIENENIPITIIDPPPPPPKPRVANPIETTEPDPEPVPDNVIIDPIEIPEVIPDPIDEGPKDEKVDNSPFLIVEKMPSPEGGLEALYKFINKKLKYPAQARRMGIEGTVYMSFVVDEKGNMVDIQIAKGIGAGCDEEVLRIFENPPKWNPGKQRGVPVKVRQMIPVKFVLN
ncbi:energy transducer TonB [Fulvivirga kasyanovii]|uniref:TonB family protein n=1 Tax=Fulvivirga kasyanovii TaxID=396812 RepID=A0ABW9RP12_9BACT|nr:energy transducer TonB [Fulvivirga kasyanovii]MTI25645.1 TonB family protein [Fulvivirga kasyanovii]